LLKIRRRSDGREACASRLPEGGAPPLDSPHRGAGGSAVREAALPGLSASAGLKAAGQTFGLAASAPAPCAPARKKERTGEVLSPLFSQFFRGVLALKYLRRLLWFTASRLLIVTFCAALITLAFYMAMNTANIYILVSDGMQARADMILTRESSSDLDNYFRDEFLAEDDALKVALSENSPWVDYAISDYEYDLSMQWMWTWPWEDTATATISERIDGITGKVVAESQSLVNSGLISASPPAWQGGEYAVTLYRADGRWRIAGLRQTKIFVEETPVPEPTAAPAPPQELEL